MKNKLNIKFLIYCCIALFVTLVFPFKFEIDFDTFFKIINVMILTFISDNMIIMPNKKNRLITNVVGFLLAFFYGKEYILVSVLTVCFRLDNKSNLLNRLNRAVIYYIMYYSAALIAGTPDNLISVFSFLIISLSLNFILTYDRKNEDFRLYLYEFLFFISLLPTSYIFITSHQESIKYISQIFGLAFTVFYYFIFKYVNEKKDEVLKNEKLQNFNQIIFDFSQILNSYSMNQNNETILDQVAEMITKELGYQRVMISLLNKEKGYIERIAFRGIDEELKIKIMNNKVKISEVMHFFLENNRYLETYFIPFEKNYIYRAGLTYTVQNEPIELDDIDNYFLKNIWKNEDLLFVALRDKENELIGYISCDMPRSGLRPSKEDLTILSVLGQITSIVLNGSKIYKSALDTANKDGLTGLFNHTKLYNDIESEANSDNKYSIAFFDMDNFKLINDKNGHLYGDKIIRYISQALRESVDESGKIYRYGGDEFVILFKNTDKESAKNYIKDFYNKIYSYTDEPISFSVGIADNSDSDNLKELINIADKRAYISKNSGKGKIII